MITLGNALKNVKPSPTIAASTRAEELKREGRDIISFSVGEPDIGTPEHIKQAAREAMDKGFTRYTPVAGIKELKEVICAKLKRDNNLDYGLQEVIVTNGGKQAIAAACAVILNPGDEVIIPAPYWTSFPDMVYLAGGTPVIVKTKPEEGYVLKPEALLKAATPRTKMIILNSPSNPSGAAYTEAELKEFGAAVRAMPNAKEVVVLSDEVYEYIVYDGFKHCSFATANPDLKDNTVIVNAFSKAYSMTGWRVGYAAGPKNIISAMATHQGQFTSNICSIAQYAAARAYDDNYAFPKMMREEFAKRFQIVCDAVADMPGASLPVKPRGAFYGFIRIEGLLGKKHGDNVIKNPTDFVTLLLEKYDVAAVQGEAFGDDKAFRISYALATEDLKKGLARITEAVKSLN